MGRGSLSAGLANANLRHGPGEVEHFSHCDKVSQRRSFIAEIHHAEKAWLRKQSGIGQILGVVIKAPQ